MITVRKPTQDEISEMKSCSTWGCEVSQFNWHYDEQETCLILEGKVTVTYDGGEASFGAGDFVVFPQGLSCVWNVKEAVKKHYKFG